MIIRQLSLTNFRAFKRLELEFPSNLNIIVGENAQGKTSILEAVHFLSLLTSSIASHDRQMIRFLALEDEIPVCRLVAVVEKASKLHRIEVRLIMGGSGNSTARLRKEVIIDGAKRKLLDAVGYFNSVIFFPQMMRIIEDGPDERRKYLNRTLSQAFPRYVRALSAYNQGIVRRNALLRQIFEQGSSRDQLIYWDDLIAKHGAVIVHSRANAVRTLSTYMHKQHERLTHGGEKIALSYQPSIALIKRNGEQSRLNLSNEGIADITVDEIREIFLRQLRDQQDEEVRRGVTTIGPHRDELRFIANDIDLGIYGSRGQIRTAIIALKLAEVYWLQSQTGETPVLLLDETLAELDQQRRQDLLDVLSQNSQSVLTTTDLHLFYPDFVGKCRVWHIYNGEIKEKDN
ncbi:MAG: DNA replication/repair protein RecF [Anaerolineaceae bacterium]|nr:DNA replication/repair protein RecF [Anaerolineaceae bacterium]